MTNPVSADPQPPAPAGPDAPEPVFNLPGVVTALAVLLIAIHAIDGWLPVDLSREVLLTFAFLPIRYDAALMGGMTLPGGAAGDVWTFLTYAFLHGSWSHVFVNVLWMTVFGSAVARRFGPLRFLLLSAVCAIAGALVHLLAHFGEAVPMIGASAAISGQMAAATRFVFQMGGPLGAIRRRDALAYRVPATGLVASLANPSVIAFLGVWFAINLLFGLWSVPLAGEGGSVAWEAHIGGFLAGFLLFRLFDPVRAGRS